MTCGVYCAICGCSLDGGEVGSSDPIALARRRDIVDQTRRARARGDSDPDPGALGHPDDAGTAAGVDPRSRDWWDRETEDASYDPRLITEESLEWLYSSCCLGNNLDDASVGGRTFISGRITEDFRRDVRAVESGNDPNQPENGSLVYYIPDDTNGTVVFPFHHCCLDILAEVLTGSPNASDIDKDVLFDVMAELTADNALCLSLDYGPISGQQDCLGNSWSGWISVSGEEFSVANPSVTAGVTALLEQFLADGRLFAAARSACSSFVLEREPRVHDPFSQLPNEILMTVFDLLAGPDLLALLKASWPAFCATRSNGFWKWRLKHHMPWLNQLWPLLDRRSGEPGPDYKTLYLWVDKFTTPEYGMDGPLAILSLANRRRIWGVCEQLAVHYFRQLKASPLLWPDREILEGAICRNMTLLRKAERPDSSWVLQRTLFSFSGDRVDNLKPLIIEAYWRGEALVGMTAVLGEQRRVFGLDGAGMAGIERTATRIPGNHQIRAFIISFATPNPNGDYSPGIIYIHPRVTGIRILCGRHWGDYYLNPRVRDSAISAFSATALLTVSRGARLAGITGHIDRHGVVQSIGPLEVSEPASRSLSGNASASPPVATPNEDMEPSVRFLGPGHCWTQSAAKKLISLTVHSHTVDRVLPLMIAPAPGGNGASLAPPHYRIPQEILMFGADSTTETHEDALSSLACIRLYIKSRSDSTSTTGRSSRPAAVYGIEVQQHVRNMKTGPMSPAIFHVPKRRAGLKMNMLDTYSDLEIVEYFQTWADIHGQVVAFDVDGPGGEKVDEVAVAVGEVEVADHVLAFRLKTNKGREMSIGDPGSRGWTSQRAPEGEVIVGLAVGFTGKTDVWPTLWGYGSLSSVSLLTKRLGAVR